MNLEYLIFFLLIVCLNVLVTVIIVQNVYVSFKNSFKQKIVFIKILLTFTESIVM